MATHHREVETKLEPPEGAALPGFEAAPRVASTTAPLELPLDAEYFDTADLALAAAGSSLRRRSGGVDDGWHLKAPAGAARAEVQLPLDGSRAVPEALRDAVRLHARAEPLSAVVRLRTRRRVLRLLDADGTALIEIADDEVAAAPADGGPSDARRRPPAARRARDVPAAARCRADRAGAGGPALARSYGLLAGSERARALAPESELGPA